MSNELEPKPASSQTLIYQIRLKGHLGREWINWFEGLTILLEEGGDTLLSGPVADQAALHGFLKRVRDLGMPLISVVQVPFGETRPYRLEKRKKMNTNQANTEIDPRVKLSLLWIFVILLMVYADIISLMDPTSAIRVRMVGSPMSEGFLLAGAIVMVTSIAMVILSWVLSYKVNRWVTIVAGVFMIQQILAGGHGLYYVFFETVEVTCILLIIWFAWKWKPVFEHHKKGDAK